MDERLTQFTPLKNDLTQVSQHGVYGYRDRGKFVGYNCDVDNWPEHIKIMFLAKTLTLINELKSLDGVITPEYQKLYNTVMARAEKTALVRRKNDDSVTDRPLEPPKNSDDETTFNEIIEWYEAKSGSKRMKSVDTPDERTEQDKQLYNNYLESRGEAEIFFGEQLRAKIQAQLRKGGKRTRHRKNRGRKKKTRRNRRAKQ